MAQVKQTVEIPDKEIKKYAGDQIRKLEKEVTRLKRFITTRDNNIEKFKTQIELLKFENKAMQSDKRLVRMSGALRTLISLAEEAEKEDNTNYRVCRACESSIFDPGYSFDMCPYCGESI